MHRGVSATTVLQPLLINIDIGSYYTIIMTSLYAKIMGIRCYMHTYLTLHLRYWSLHQAINGSKNIIIIVVFRYDRNETFTCTTKGTFCDRVRESDANISPAPSLNNSFERIDLNRACILSLSPRSWSILICLCSLS